VADQEAAQDAAGSTGGQAFGFLKTETAGTVPRAAVEKRRRCLNIVVQSYRPVERRKKVGESSRFTQPVGFNNLGNISGIAPRNFS